MRLQSGCRSCCNKQSRFLQILAIAVIYCAIARDLRAQSGDLQPAMIAQGGDSVAAKLHYPEKAKAEKKEAAVQFYCEVNIDGHTRHRTIIAEDTYGPFYRVVQKAIQQGRFTPARVSGKPVQVMIGGTVQFLSSKGQSTIVVSLATANKERAAGHGNYIQPQMLRSYKDLERKIWTWKNSIILGSMYPAAEVMMDVDANGNLAGTKITHESIKGGGLGAVLVKACEGAKFIPAYDNGKRVAGQMNLPMNYKEVVDPDSDTQGHLKPIEQ